MVFRFEQAEPPGPWGGRQPKFERLESEGPDRFFLVYQSPSGEEVRVQLAAATTDWPRE